MPYTRVWSETDPPGTALAASLDTIIQNKTTDIRERVAGIFGLTALEWAADPVVPKTLSLLTSLTVPSIIGPVTFTGAITGNVTGNLTGTVLTASQPNITGLGTLTGLIVTPAGSTTLSNVVTIGGVAGNDRTLNFTDAANTFAIKFITSVGSQRIAIIDGGGVERFSVTSATVTGVSFTGTLLTAAQPNITSLGTLVSLSAGNITSTGDVTSLSYRATSGGNLTIGPIAGQLRFTRQSAERASVLGESNGFGEFQAATFIGNLTGNLTGTILTAAQGNITSLGTLTSLTVSGASSFGGNITITGGVTTFSTSGDLYFRAFGNLRLGSGNANDRLVLDDSGRILIGTLVTTGVAAGGIHVAGNSVFDGFINGAQNKGIFIGNSFFGQQGSGYGEVGYNNTDGLGNANYAVNDFASRVRFNSGGLSFQTAPSGVAGNAIGWTERMLIANSGAVTANGAWTFNSTVSGITTLTATNLSGNLTGTILTAAQANITSLGTLSALTVSGLTDLTGTLKVGGGATISKVYTATLNWDVPSLAAHTSTSTTVAVTGAAAGDLVLVQVVGDDILDTAGSFVSGAGTVTVFARNHRATIYDAGATDFKVFVMRLT